MRLFSTIIIAGAHANPDFWVTNCQNTATNAIEMTIGLTEAYMDEHHEALKPSFTFDSTLGEYTNIIPGNSLRQDFTDPDYIYLEYDMVQLDETVDNLIDFPGRTTAFKCRYPRTVTLTDSVTHAPTDPSIAEETGQFAFDFAIATSGGRTTVGITPLHGITNLVTNVQECEITLSADSNQTIFPIHSFHDDGTCIDDRIQTTLAAGNGIVTLGWRSFHFNDGSSTSQQQNVICEVLISNSLSVSTPPACPPGCYNADECSSIIFEYDGTIDLHGITDIASGLTVPRLYEFSYEFMLNAYLSGNVMALYGRDHDTATIEQKRTCGFNLSSLWVTASRNHYYFLRHTCINGRNTGSETDPVPLSITGQWLTVKTGQREENGVLYYYHTIEYEHGIISDYLAVQDTDWTVTDGQIRVGHPYTQGQIRNITLTDTT